jgi:hypothetical protein
MRLAIVVLQYMHKNYAQIPLLYAIEVAKRRLSDLHPASAKA